MNERKPLEQHPVMQAIKKAAGHLVMPRLTPLSQVSMDMQADRDARCGEIELHMEDLRQEAHHAVTRLMLPDVQKLQVLQEPYFKQIRAGGIRDE